jgi:hypothetical protein
MPEDAKSGRSNSRILDDGIWIEIVKNQREQREPGSNNALSHTRRKDDPRSLPQEGRACYVRRPHRCLPGDLAFITGVYNESLGDEVAVDQVFSRERPTTSLTNPGGRLRVGACRAWSLKGH